jgi:hypothetical protein
MLDCDRSLASHRYTSMIMTQKMVTAITIATKKKDEVSPMTALISGPTDWILSTAVYRALIAGDPSCLLHGQSQRPVASVVHTIEELTPRRWMWCL